MASQDDPRDTAPVPEPAPTTLDPTTLDPTKMLSANDLAGQTINNH